MATLQLKRGTTAELKTIVGTDGEIYVNTDTNELVAMDGVTPGGVALAKAKRTSTAQEATRSNKFNILNDVIVGEDYLPVIDLGVVHNGTTNYTCRLTTNYNTSYGDVEHDEEWFKDLPLIADAGLFHVLTNGLPFISTVAITKSGILTSGTSTKENWYVRYLECMDWAHLQGIKVLINVNPNTAVFEQGYLELNGTTEGSAAVLNNLINEFKSRVGDHPAVSGFTDEYNMLHVSKSRDPQGVVARDAVIAAIADNTTPTVAVIEAVIEREPISFQVEAATRSGVQLTYFSEWKRDRDGSLGTIHTLNTTGENPYALHMIGFGADYIYGNAIPAQKRDKIEIFSDARDANNMCLTGGSLTMEAMATDGVTRIASLLDIHGAHHGASVSFWVRSNGDTAGTKNIITREATNGKYGYRVQAIDGHLTVATQWHDNTQSPSWLGGSTYTDPDPISDTWDFYVIQGDNDTKRMTVYKNGYLLYSLDRPGLTYTSPKTEGQLKMLGDGGYDIAQVMFHYRELEQKEVNTMYVYDLLPARDVYRYRWPCAVARFDFANGSLSDSIGYVTVFESINYAIDETLNVPDLTPNGVSFGTFTKPVYRKV